MYTVQQRVKVAALVATFMADQLAADYLGSVITPEFITEFECSDSNEFLWEFAQFNGDECEEVGVDLSTAESYPLVKAAVVAALKIAYDV